MASVGSPYGDAKISMALMRAGADVNVADSNGETALWAAATTGPDEVFDELLRRGANPNVRVTAMGFPGYTPLHMAAYSGSTKKVALLLQYGADPAIRNDEGQTPLDITNVKFEEVRKLLYSHSEDGH
jgi:ankyrin repeat protein